jgi:hypothetical protein
MSRLKPYYMRWMSQGSDHLQIDPYAGRFAAVILSTLLTCILVGCSSINEKLSTGVGDYIPQWAGGLPSDAPPRPGTPQYDEYMREREKNRLLPADQRNKSDETKPDSVH